MHVSLANLVKGINESLSFAVYVSDSMKTVALKIVCRGIYEYKLIVD